jgi:hypothetical protein
MSGVALVLSIGLSSPLFYFATLFLKSLSLGLTDVGYGGGPVDRSVLPPLLFHHLSS